MRDPTQPYSIGEDIVFFAVNFECTCAEVVLLRVMRPQHLVTLLLCAAADLTACISAEVVAVMTVLCPAVSKSTGC